MTATLGTYEQKIREAEEVYCARLNGDGADNPGSPVVRGAIELREEGLDNLRAGYLTGAMYKLGKSVRLLGAYNIDGNNFSPSVEGFDREIFASLAASAQALCAAGEFEYAVKYAELARLYTPTRLLLSERAGEDLPDQIEVDYSGRLALICATGEWGSYSRRISPLMFRRARAIAPISQDPRAVVFTNNELTPEERKESARKAIWFANVGSVIARTPSTTVRDFAAEHMCAK